MREKLAELQSRALAELEQVGDLEALETWRVQFLGGRGALRELQRGLSGLPPAADRELNSSWSSLHNS